MNSFFQELGDIAVSSSLACALLYFIGFIKNNKTYKIFCIYLIVISIIQISSYYVGRGGFGKPNLFLSHYYFVSQFILLSLFYAQLLKYKWIYIIMIIVLIFLGYQYIRDPAIYFKYNPTGMTLTHGIIVVYSLLYLYKCLQEKNDFLIVNVGIFFYLLSSTLIFASGNLVFDITISADALNLLISLNTVLYLIFHILIIIEWIKNLRISST